MHFIKPDKKSSIIKVIGVGGGGGNAVNHMFKQGIEGVEFIICNTDAQALEASPIPNKYQLGEKLTEGLGAGADPEKGKKAAIESIADIQKVLEDQTKMIFITAGMGGGTGTGAAPIIAKAAKDLGILTVGIVTTPFKFEGAKRIARAEEGIQRMKESVDSLLVINNEKLRDMFGNLQISKAFESADNILATAAKSIAEIITHEGYINVDFQDVKTVMANSGVALMGTGLAEGEDRALVAARQALSHPLLAENDISGAKHILLNVSSGSKEILMDEITHITNVILEEAGEEADVIWGNAYDEKLGDKVSVTIIATAFEGKKGKPISIQEIQKIPLEIQNLPADIAPKEPEITPTEPLLFEHFMRNDKPKEQSVSELSIQRDGKPFKKENSYEELERVPAYVRRGVKFEQVKATSDSEISRFTLSDEKSTSMKPQISKNNRFLHDNVD